MRELLTGSTWHGFLLRVLCLDAFVTGTPNIGRFSEGTFVGC